MNASKSFRFLSVSLFLYLFLLTPQTLHAQSWSPMTSGVTSALKGVWGTSSNDVFAVGLYGTILHYDGSSWSPMTSGTTSHLSGVWGTASNDVFAVGDGGTILRYNGSSWSAMDSSTGAHLEGVWGTGSTDVFAVGDNGWIIHYNGSSWSSQNEVYIEDLWAVWGAASNDVFVGSSRWSESILHYDGASWVRMSTDPADYSFGVWGTASSDVFAVGAIEGSGGSIIHYDGTSWSTMISGTIPFLRGVWGAASNDVFAVGDEGTILHYDGSSWSTMISGTVPRLNNVWGTASTDVFAVGDNGTILHYGVVINSPPNPPVLSSPLDGATEMPLTPTLLTEPYSDPDGDSHIRTEWQIGTDTEFQFPTLNQTSSTALTSLPVAEAVLGTGTIYYWRVRFYDNQNGVSGWSEVSSFTTLSIANQPPAWPVLSSPADGATDVSLTPLLQTTGFSDPDSGDTHLWTEYQVSSEADFSSPVLHSQRTLYTLTSLQVPDLALVARTTYYWRVRFFDNHSNGSEWSEVFSFTTQAATNDLNDNGIPDSQENDTVDLNNDGTPDSEQEEIKSMDTVVGGGQIGASREESANVTSIDSIDSRDPEEISAEVRPHSMPLGLFSIRVTVATFGDTVRVTVYFSEAAPAEAKWYQYDSINMWQDYSAYVTFSEDRMSVVLELKDGGSGDADGLANGVIVDPGGFGLASWIKGMVYDSATGQPIANAEVRIGETVVNTDLDGSYVSMYLPGTYTLSTAAAGYDSQSLPGVVINEGGIAEQDFGLSAAGGEGPDTGYLIDFQTKDQDLWVRAVINTVEKGAIEAVWRQGGQSTTARGDEVVWGHFYASPSDVTWGSMNNPDLYAKIWFDAGGRLDVNFFHVSVPDIVVYSDYAYDGTADEQGTTTMSTRYIRQYYQNGESHSEEQTEDGNPPAGGSPTGNPTSYPTLNSLNIGALINTEELGLIDAVWQLGGTDSTVAGDEVVWGHFYASSSDVSWGSAANPDLFVKVWFDNSGRIDVNFFHVSVPDIEVYSDYPGDGSYDQAGTTIMSNRYIRQQYQR